MTEETVKRQVVTMNDLKNREYISLKIGETAEIVISKMEKVEVDKDFSLSGETFRYEITTDDNKILSISAWKLWGALREAFNKAGKIDGLKLRVSHPGREDYRVEIIG